MAKRKKIPDFDFNELAKISFGELEGEDDEKALSQSLIITNSISQLLNRNYNYVLSPKGAGKSAIFNAFQNKLFSKEDVDFNVKNYICINDSFVYDDEYLNPSKFKHNLENKNYTFAWGLYLISKLINDIITNHYDKLNYSDFQNEIKKIENFKEDFDLTNIWDRIEKLNVQCDFIVAGQKLTVAPKVGSKNQRKRIKLNDIFKLINNFYKDNKIETVILIDRIDNFVGHEEYLIQKKYIQGLVNSIEEIRHQSNIHPILFLRTDLFQTLDISFEFDKAKARTLYLKWTQTEILRFITLRFLSNRYIEDNYKDIIIRTIYKELDTESRFKRFLKFKFKETKPWQKLSYKQNTNYIIFESFLKAFLPDKINHFNNEGTEEEIDIFKWLYSHFIDNNEYINPRCLIYFFNSLCLEQYNVYLNDINLQTSDFLCKLTSTKPFKLNVFLPDVIVKTYKDICNKELLGIRALLDTSNHQQMFEKLNENSYKDGVFSFGGVSFKKQGLDKKEYERLIKHLDILGFCKHIGSRRYSVPIIYRTLMNKEQ